MSNEKNSFYLDNAPRAIRRPHYLTHLNDTRLDNYFWLNDRENPEVINYLRKENDYLDSYMLPFSSLKESIFNEVTGRIKQVDDSVPYLRNGYYYYHRFEEGSEFPIYARKEGDLNAPEEILIDVNQEAKNYAYYKLSQLSISPDNKLMAICEDILSRRIYRIRIKQLDKDIFYDEIIANTGDAIVWYQDNKSFLYITRDLETLRPDKIFKHIVGTNSDTDMLVYEEKDEACYLNIHKSNSGKFIYIHSTSTITSEVRFIEADDASGSFRIFSPKKRDQLYFVTDDGKQFFIRTNVSALNFKVMTAPLDATHIEHWSELIPHRDDVLIESISCFADFITLEERKDGILKLRILYPDREEIIDFEEDAYLATFINNYEFQPEYLRFIFTSMTTPVSVFDYDLKSGKRKLRKRQEVVGGYDPDEYQSRRLMIVARDGVEVPVSLVYKKSLYKENMPLLLYGYGAYGISLDPSFAVTRISLLDRGFIYAIAHVRGGEDLGRQWYQAGKMLNKKNTFFDFIDCAEALVASAFTSREHLYAMGGSAGGMLMGAAMNMRPELFRGIISVVPFVDVLTTMLDETIPLTTGEYDEWGNPNEQQYYDYMKSYSPVDNVTEQAYPALLVTTGLHDSQVQYWEPAKWIAKLRVHNTSHEPILLYTNMDTGHGGHSGRFERYRETALIYTFLCSLENIDK